MSHPTCNRRSSLWQLEYLFACSNNVKERLGCVFNFSQSCSASGKEGELPAHNTTLLRDPRAGVQKDHQRAADHSLGITGFMPY